MVTAKQAEETKKAREEAERQNPLLKLSLGDLIREMNALSYGNPDVLKPRDKVPSESMRDYLNYQSLVDELNRREIAYNMVPLAEQMF